MAQWVVNRGKICKIKSVHPGTKDIPTHPHHTAPQLPIPLYKSLKSHPRVPNIMIDTCIEFHDPCASMHVPISSSNSPSMDIIERF